MNLRSVLYLVNLVIFIGFQSCSNTPSKDSVVSQWLGKKIELIDSLPVYDPVTSSFTKLHDQDLLKKRIVVYIDGTCFNCAEDFYKWSRVVDSLKSKDVSFIFYFHILDIKVMQPYFRQWRFTHPIVIDTANVFYKKNDLSLIKLYQSFVLDESNKVIVFGNPVYSEDIKELYYEVIDGKYD